MINRLQEKMLTMQQADIETSHTFCNGVYAREIRIPEGVCLVGAKHKTAFFLTVSMGECVIIDGNNEFTLEAPCTIVSPVGAKRVIYAITDTVLTTYHKTNKTDIVSIEKEIIEPEGLRIANNPTRGLK